MSLMILYFDWVDKYIVNFKKFEILATNHQNDFTYSDRNHSQEIINWLMYFICDNIKYRNMLSCISEMIDNPLWLF